MLGKTLIALAAATALGASSAAMAGSHGSAGSSHGSTGISSHGSTGISSHGSMGMSKSSVGTGVQGPAMKGYQGTYSRQMPYSGTMSPSTKYSSVQGKNLHFDKHDKHGHHHFRNRNFIAFGFAGPYFDYGYDSCWRLVQTYYGWQRVYVCGDYPYWGY